MIPIFEESSLFERRQLVMAGMRAVVAVSIVIASASGNADARSLVSTGVYLIAAALVEFIRRTARVRGELATNVLLVTDILFIQWVSLTSGPWGRELAFLPVLQTVVVTLNFSVRAGLKTAIGQSLVAYVVIALAQGKVIDAPLIGADGVVLRCVGVWVVTLFTTALRSVNEIELRRRRAQVVVAADLGAELQQATNVSTAAGMLTGLLSRHFACPRSVVCVRDGARWSIHSEDRNAAESGGLSLSIDDAGPVLLARSAEGGQLVEAALPGATNVLAIPMTTTGQMTGLFLVEWGPSLTGIPRSTIELIGDLAERTGVTIKSLRLADDLRRMAAVDALTGLANRASFDKALEIEVQRSKRTGSPFALVLLDIDHFKQINVGYGRQAGDDVLRSIGRALRKACRAYDLPARIGDEEIAVLVPGCTPGDAVAVAERYRGAVAASGSRVPVTASAGVAWIEDKVENAAELYKAADSALSMSKHAGRDRTTPARSISDRS